MPKDAPPPENDLGQNAIPVNNLNLDNFGPKGHDAPPVQYEVCAICGFIYKKTNMVKYQNKWYCREREDYRDIVGIRLNQNPEAEIKNKGLADRFYTRGQ